MGRLNLVQLRVDYEKPVGPLPLGKIGEGWEKDAGELNQVQGGRMSLDHRLQITMRRIQRGRGEA
jgi:hypothetical protein